jgi:prepilin-type N-terminal cleavage/methylation domain-containing protein
MNKKGFTLVELLGTIVVLSIILIITVPSIIQTMRRAEINEASAFITRLYNASETYIEINREAFDQLQTTGGFVDIPVAVLLNEGLIRELGSDPDTLVAVTADDSVTATKLADGTIEYELYKENTNIADYIQDGLVFHLDAINNFGFGHSNTTTIWNDLTSNHSDATLMNFNFNASSGWTDKGLKLDGSNDKALTSSSGLDFSMFKSGQAFTFGTRFTTTTVTSWQGIFTNMTSWGTGGFTVQYGTTQNIGVGMGVYLSNASPATTNTTYTVYGVYNGSVMSLYVNGTYIGQTTYSITEGDPILTIGAFYSTPNLLTNGIIHNILFYNRALNTTEMNNNIALDVIRFR